jgi:hypothetical protein
MGKYPASTPPVHSISCGQNIGTSVVLLSFCPITAVFAFGVGVPVPATATATTVLAFGGVYATIKHV